MVDIISNRIISYLSYIFSVKRFVVVRVFRTPVVFENLYVWDCICVYIKEFHRYITTVKISISRKNLVNIPRTIDLRVTQIVCLCDKLHWNIDCEFSCRTWINKSHNESLWCRLRSYCASNLECIWSRSILGHINWVKLVISSDLVKNTLSIAISNIAQISSFLYREKLIFIIKIIILIIRISFCIRNNSTWVLKLTKRRLN